MKMSNLLRNANMRKLWLPLVLLLLIISSVVAAPIFLWTHNAELTLTAEQGSVLAKLYAENMDDGTPIVITVIDDTGQNYLLPAIKTSATTWETTFPLTNIEKASAKQGRRTLAKTTSVTEVEETKEKQEKDKEKPLKKLHFKIKDKKLIQAITLRTIEGDIQVLPVDMPIKSIIFKELDEEQLATKTLRIGEPIITKEDLQGVAQSAPLQTYAIDPEELNFTNATVTVQAKGTRLYKCAAWNYDLETCEGTWELIKIITPGEEYNLTLTPKDPAFAEVTILAMEWGTITNLNDTWQTINFTYDYVNPVIIVTPHYQLAGVPTVSRIDNVTSTGFMVRLQVAGIGTATTRNSHYLVVEAGNWTLPNGDPLEAYTYTSTTTDENNDWTPDNIGYTNSYTNPVVMAQVMSYNDTDWSAIWTSDGTQANPPSTTELHLAKHVGEDSDVTRTDEIIGYIVFESSHSNLTGIDYDANLGADSVQGVGDSPPYSTSFTSSFSSAPTVIIVTMAAMDGGNGGWGVAYGAITTTTTGVATDEDTENDAERVHTPEQMSVIAFATAGTFLYNNAPIIINETLSRTLTGPETPIIFNVTVTDTEGLLSVEFVNATIIYPNSTTINLSLNQVAIGQDITSNDQETGIMSIEAENAQAIGETGTVLNVNSWTHVTTTHTYTTPRVFVFSKNQSNIGSMEEQSLAIVKNITANGFDVAVIMPDDILTTDDVNYLVIENGTHALDGITIDVGQWSYSGTVFVSRSFGQTFSTDPTVYMQLQEQTTDKWYAGRYDDGTLSTSSINIQYEDSSNSFSGIYNISYIAFEQGSISSIFEGDVETGISEDPGASSWRALSFTNSHDSPIFMGLISDAGGDPTKLGTGSLTTSTVNIRPTEETISDAEQNHATNDALWMVFNGSMSLYTGSSETDNEAEKTITTYNDVMNDSINLLSSIEISLNITEYNNSGSVTNANANPRLKAYLMSDSGWISIGEKSLFETGTITWTSYDSALLADWVTTTNRDVRIDVTHFDYNSTTAKDKMSWNETLISLSGGTATSTWRIQIPNTDQYGVYNITDVYTSDGIENVSKNYATLNFTIADIESPTFTFITNQTFGTTEPIEVTFAAYDYSGIDYWGVNESSFSINATGFLTNVSALTEGIYALNITVNDTFGNVAWESIIVNITSVPDTIPPQFVPVLTNITSGYGTALYYNINATDDRGRLEGFSINDTTNFAIDYETGELTNNTILSVGTLLLNVSINDTTGNVNSSILTIIITDTMLPQINIVNQTIEEGEHFLYQVNATDDIAIDTYWLTGTTDFTMNETGYITNTSTFIKDNVYPMYIHVNDTTGNERIVYFTVTVEDTRPPGTIIGLTVTSYGKDYINWSWTNPTDGDFSQLIIYINGQSYLNTSATNLYYTGLELNTTYNISIRTKDTSNNVNTTWVNDSQTSQTNIAPTATYLPINNTYFNTESLLLIVTPTDLDDTTVCVEITVQGTQGTSSLYNNCTALNATPTNYNWTGIPQTTLAQTQVLWHFDNFASEGETDTYVKDFAGADNNRTCIIDCPTWTTNGKYGGAYTYDGTASYWVLDEAYFNTVFTEKTFEAWIKANTTTGTRNIYDEGGSTNGYGVRINDDLLEFATRSGGTQATIGIPYTDTNWHHVAAVFDNNNMSLYLDGILVNNTVASFVDIPSHSDEGGLGGMYGSGAFGSATGIFQGIIDDVRITDLALNQTEIARAMNFSDGNYLLNITVLDGFANITYTNINYTKDTEIPEVTLNTPVINYSNNATTWDYLTFNCTATDTVGLANISLYLTNATNESFSLNETTIISSMQATTTWNLNLTEGYYAWNCLVTDLAGNKDWEINRTINISETVDLYNPTINNILPIENMLYNATQTITLQANVTDNKEIGIVYVNVTLPNSTLIRINLIQYGATSIYNNTYHIPVLIGTYNISYFVNDTYGNSNTTTSNFTASYGGIISIGETYDPTENDYPFYYYANYTYYDGTPIEGATCTMELLNHTKLGYYFTPEDTITLFNGTKTYGATTFEYIENNIDHTNYLVKFNLAYNGTGDRDWKIWVTNDTTQWTSAQTPKAIINKTTHPTLNETIQELYVTIPDNEFNTTGNYTVIFGCADCTSTEYFLLGADVDNFGHSFITSATSANWTNITSFNYEHMVEFEIGSKVRNMTYNASVAWYETLERLYLTKNTTYVYTWEANCTKLDHTTYSEQTTITIAINYAPIPNITSIAENPTELGEPVTIEWDNDYTGQAFGFYDSYVNLTYANGTFIAQYEGSPFIIPTTDILGVGTYNLTAYAENSQGSDTANAIFTVQDTIGPLVTNITPNKTSLYPQVITITANVTDLQAVDSVFANVTWLGGYQLIELLDQNTNNIYEGNFTATVTKNHTITILSNDTENNRNDTEINWFNIINNVIGEEINITTNSENVTVYLNETRINTSDYYNNLYNITIYVNSTLVASFYYDFSLPLNLTTMSAYNYMNEGIAFSMPNQEDIMLYTPLQGSTCYVTICEGVNNETACTGLNTRYETVTPTTYCPVLVNGTYAKDAPDRTDFLVEITDIETTPLTPKEGENMTINVTIRNIGETWADNVTVQITDITLNSLLLNYTITNFTTSQNESVITWSVMNVGSHEIQVVIDPENKFIELNESNNNATIWRHVSGWHTFYGYINYTMGLEGLSNIFYEWTTMPAQGNIYAIDSDASITWSNVQALTRDTDGLLAINDLLEADQILNTENNVDSIVAQYGLDNSIPHTTINATIYGLSIENIPVINSTNSSNFQTGILWDTTTSGPGDYAGTEPLIFMTSINQNKQGAYGIYDYEIVIPSTLEETEGGSDTTYLYIELT